jgi:hypothetical protein
MLEKSNQETGQKPKVLVPITFQHEDLLTARSQVLTKNPYALVAQMYAASNEQPHIYFKQLDSFERALATFSAATLALRDAQNVPTLEEIASLDLTPEAKLKTQSQLSSATYLSNSAALAFAGYVGLHELSLKPVVDYKDEFSFGKSRDSQDRVQLQKILVGELDKQLQAESKKPSATSMTATKTDAMLVYTNPTSPNRAPLTTILSHLYTSWINQYTHDVAKNLLATELAELDIPDFKLQYENLTFEDGKLQQKHTKITVDERIMPVRVDQVIGNTEYVTELTQFVTQLLLYDPVTRKNPVTVPSVVFTYGDPGCGKTFTAHAIMRHAISLAEKYDKPLWAFTHSVTDYASEFQNKTAVELAKLAQAVTDFAGPVLMYGADIDVVAKARSSRMTSEEEKTLGVYFRFFDGSLIPKNGKFLSLLDANYVDDMDPAFKSRVIDKTVILKRYESAENFAEYVKRTLERKSKLITFSDTEFQSLGKLLLESHLNNRQITNQIDNFVASANCVTEDWLTWNPAQIQEAQSDMFRSLTAKKLEERFIEFIASVQTMEEESRRKKLEENMASFAHSLSLEPDPLIQAK